MLEHGQTWEGDAPALEHLRARGFGIGRGGIIYIPADHDLSVDDNSALDYLFTEWDYAVERAQ